MGTDDRPRAFVPDGFAVPRELVAEEFRLEPLGPQHNAGDYEAWTSSIEHIRATPGFEGRPWPDPEMTPEQNLADLRRHAEDFAQRSGFTYTVLDSDGGTIIGCVYIYPSDRTDGAADVLPGSGPTGPALTPPFMTQCRRGWRTHGRSPRSATPRAPATRPLRRNHTSQPASTGTS
jgi:hypothetical protein